MTKHKSKFKPMMQPNCHIQIRYQRMALDSNQVHRSHRGNRRTRRWGDPSRKASTRPCTRSPPPRSTPHLQPQQLNEADSKKQQWGEKGGEVPCGATPRSEEEAREEDEEEKKRRRREVGTKVRRRRLGVSMAEGGDEMRTLSYELGGVGADPSHLV